MLLLISQNVCLDWLRRENIHTFTLLKQNAYWDRWYLLLYTQDYIVHDTHVGFNI